MANEKGTFAMSIGQRVSESGHRHAPRSGPVDTQRRAKQVKANRVGQRMSGETEKQKTD